jgi:hypothetical protein
MILMSNKWFLLTTDSKIKGKRLKEIEEWGIVDG